MSQTNVTLLKKKKGTREQGNSGLSEEGAPLLLLAGETFLEAVLAPLNTMEMSWGGVLTVGEAGMQEAGSGPSLGFIYIRAGVFSHK